MVVVVGRDSWMIDVRVVQYFGLTEGDVDVVKVLMLVRAVSHSWTKCCTAGSGL